MEPEDRVDPEKRRALRRSIGRSSSGTSSTSSRTASSTTPTARPWTRAYRKLMSDLDGVCCRAGLPGSGRDPAPELRRPDAAQPARPAPRTLTPRLVHAGCGPLGPDAPAARGRAPSCAPASTPPIPRAWCAASSGCAERSSRWRASATAWATGRLARGGGRQGRRRPWPGPRKRCWATASTRRLAVAHRAPRPPLRAHAAAAGQPSGARRARRWRAADAVRGARRAASAATTCCWCCSRAAPRRCCPAPVAGVTLADKAAVTSLLLRAGATIHELNTVRKHLSRLKGGGLARAAAPARVVCLVLSDVVGDDLSTIASGPTVPDPTTYADALRGPRRRGACSRRCPRRCARHLEAGSARARCPRHPSRGTALFRRVTHPHRGQQSAERRGRGPRGPPPGPARRWC